MGTHFAWLSSRTSALGPENTLWEALIHCPVIHGEGAPDTLNGHPVILWGTVTITVGNPFTSTLGLGAEGVAMPPCRQLTEALS